jgi:hypothetical protein
MLIPNRNPNAPTGSKFAELNINIGGSKRENNIVNECLSGNIPDFLRDFKPVVITIGNNTITYLVTSDYLSIGTNSDYLRIPMSPLSAQKIADKYDCTLPTRKMVNDIWFASLNKLQPSPWGPPYNSDMMSTRRYKLHNEKIQKSIISKKMDITKLISGHKKDVVLTNKLYPNNPNERVAIYGWIYKNGKPIQGLNHWSHSSKYSDYAHGIRLIANDVMVNHKPMRMKDVFTDKTLSAFVSDEGTLKFMKY